MSEWQTMETAPKDGTQVLICREGDKTAEIATYMSTTSWWELNGRDWEEKIKHYPRLPLALANFTPCWLMADNGIYAKEFEPTHWMPLPQPPEKS